MMDVMRRKKIDIVIMDVMMKGKRGIEICKDVRRK